MVNATILLFLHIFAVHSLRVLDWPVSNPVIPIHNNLTYFTIEVAPGVYHNESLIGTPKFIAESSDVVTYFSSKKHTDVLVHLSDLSSLASTDFNISKQTVFIIHGWISNHESDINLIIRHAYLSKSDVNVFVVDWSKVARWDYVTAQFNVERVGKIVGHLINNLVNGAGLKLSNIVLVGHSLGAHVAGVAGYTIGSKAHHIVALDPAGPLFTLFNKDNRIDTTDAVFVQVIHTNAGLLGFDHHLGHADYWPNGGKHQPGCVDDITGTCSHARSYIYFGESILTGNFKAISCTSYSEYKNGNCNHHNYSEMGRIAIDEKAHGSYFLHTNSHSPYAMG